MEIVIAIALLGGLGLAFGLILAAASKVFYVETDPRLDELNACLPGANCGYTSQNPSNQNRQSYCNTGLW